jgi:3-phosphoshikimate 1-carboxyvinyltransferase
MLAPVVSLFSSPVTIHGEGSLPGRPLKPLLDMLRVAGIDYDCTNDQLPLKIKGSVRNHRLKIDGSFSSQMLTGLLITLPLLSSDSVIEVHNPVSMSYIDLTLEVMNHFGVKVSHENFMIFNIKGNQQYKGTQYTIEGDWSGAANFLVAAAISGKITVEGLHNKSFQG